LKTIIINGDHDHPVAGSYPLTGLNLNGYQNFQAFQLPAGASAAGKMIKISGAGELAHGPDYYGTIVSLLKYVL
jgi:hypothetical protein